jgi:methylated-DNA-[protein]-cysteine S-methyltransferase
MDHTMSKAAMDTPTGIIEVGVDGGALVSLQFVEMSTAPPDRVAADPGGVRARLRAYYEGDLGALAEIPVRFDRGTFFQQQVWRALQGIPVGETISYAELARRVGRPSAFRAVGSANGQNPVGVVVPCHRVIAADGSLGGYAGGLDRKRWLLAHEGAMAPSESALPGLSI